MDDQKVILQMTSTQVQEDGQEAVMKLTTSGTLHRGADSTVLEYEETGDGGMTGQASIEMKGDTVMLVREGEASMRLILRREGGTEGGRVGFARENGRKTRVAASALCAGAFHGALRCCAAKRCAVHLPNGRGLRVCFDDGRLSGSAFAEDGRFRSEVSARSRALPGGYAAGANPFPRLCGGRRGLSAAHPAVPGSG